MDGKTYRCKRCGEELHMSEFPAMRKQFHGVCRLCDLKDKVRREEFARERRTEQRAHWRRQGMHVSVAGGVDERGG